jgi:hypothetical protein
VRCKPPERMHRERPNLAIMALLRRSAFWLLVTIQGDFSRGD